MKRDWRSKRDGAEMRWMWSQCYVWGSLARRSRGWDSMRLPWQWQRGKAMWVKMWKGMWRVTVYLRIQFPHRILHPPLWTLFLLLLLCYLEH
jgi:hypothetical protein